jgi:lipoprotein-releasing system permease protein
MKLPFRIAVRFLGSSRGQTILIAIGIAIGVSIQIFIGSLIQGLQKSLVDKTIGSQPHITLSSKNDDGLIKDYSILSDKIMSEVSNIEAISASADGPALVKVDEDTYSALLRGFDIDKADGIYNISDSLIEGSLPANDFETLAGTDLMNEAGLKIGDSLELITNLGQTEQFKITGIFDLGVASLNKSWLISGLDTAQKVFS